MPQFEKDITFKTSCKRRNFDAIERNITLRTFYTKLLFHSENVSLNEIWSHMSMVEGLIDLVFELEEEITELKNENS